MFSTIGLLNLMECYRDENNFAVWNCLEMCMSKVAQSKQLSLHIALCYHM